VDRSRITGYVEHREPMSTPTDDTLVSGSGGVDSARSA
jgi:hypothetical protein